MAESIILKNLSLSASSQPGITILGEPITNFIPVRYLWTFNILEDLNLFLRSDPIGSVLTASVAVLSMVIWLGYHYRHSIGQKCRWVK